MMMMTDDELHQLHLDADRAAQAERELEELQKKMKEMAEDAKNGKKVPGLLKDIEKLNERIEQQKATGEQHKQDQARLNTELRNLRQSLKAMTAEKEQVESDLSTKTHECRHVQHERDLLKDRIQELEHALNSMTDARRVGLSCNVLIHVLRPSHRLVDPSGCNSATTTDARALPALSIAISGKRTRASLEYDTMARRSQGPIAAITARSA